MSLKTMRRHQKYTRKLPKIKIDAQKSEDCRSWKLAIKNGSNPVFEPNILAGVEGLEPSRTVLETGMLPLHHTPKERHIKLFLCYNTVIGTRLWRPLLSQLNYTPIFSLLKYYTRVLEICQDFFKISWNNFLIMV